MPHNALNDRQDILVYLDIQVYTRYTSIQGILVTFVEKFKLEQAANAQFNSS